MALSLPHAAQRIVFKILLYIVSSQGGDPLTLIQKLSLIDIRK